MILDWCEKMEYKKLNKKYGLPLDTNWVICSTCGKKYPSTMEEDYSGDCSECEDLSWSERAKIKKRQDEVLIEGLI